MARREPKRLPEESAEPGHANKKAAHSSLTSAFGHSDDPSASDPALILRIITGANLKDIVDGQLVEEVDEEAEAREDDSKAMLSMLRREGEERTAMRRELTAVKQDVAEIKDLITTLLARG